MYRMKTIYLNSVVASIAVIACVFAITTQAFAETSVSAGVSASTSVKTGERFDNGTQTKREGSYGARVAEVKARAKAEIDRRIDSLNKLIGRLDNAKRVSADAKARLTADTNALIVSLKNLGAQIQSETSTSSLKARVQSINGSYRVYLLVVPKGHLLAAADRIKTTADLMTSVDSKLKDGIAKANAAGKDTSSLEVLRAESIAKIASAKTQADAAIALLTPLKPDEKNNVVFEENKKALRDARAKIKAGTDDLKVARGNAHKIIVELKKMGIYANASASSTVQTR